MCLEKMKYILINTFWKKKRMSYNFYTSAPPRAKKKDQGDEDEIVNNAYTKIWLKFAKQPETEAKDKDGDDEEEEGEEEGEGEKKEKKVYIIDGVEIDAENTFLNFTFLENLPREIFVDVILSFVEPSECLNFLTALWQTKMPRLRDGVHNLFKSKRFYEQIKPDQDKFVPKNAFDNTLITDDTNWCSFKTPVSIRESIKLYRKYLFQFLEFVTMTSMLKIIMLHNSPIVHFCMPRTLEAEDENPLSNNEIDKMLRSVQGLTPSHDHNYLGVTRWGVGDWAFYLRISVTNVRELASVNWGHFFRTLPAPKVPDLYLVWGLYNLFLYLHAVFGEIIPRGDYISLIWNFRQLLTNLNFTRKSLTEMLGVSILLNLKQYSEFFLLPPGDFHTKKGICEKEVEDTFNSITQLIDVKELPYPPKWITMFSILTFEGLSIPRIYKAKTLLKAYIVLSILGPLLMKFLRPIMKLDKNDKLIDGRIQKIYELVNEKNRVELERTKDMLQGINPGFENLTFDDIKLYCCSEYEKRFKKKVFKEEIEKSIEKTRKKMNDVRNRMTNVEKVQADFKKLDRRLERTLERINKDTKQAMEDLQSGKQHFGKYTKPVIEEGDDEIIKGRGEKQKKREKERINKIKLRRVLKEMQLLLKQDRGSPEDIKELEWLISKAKDLQHATRTVKFDSLLKKARETLNRWSILNEVQPLK